MIIVYEDKKESDILRKPDWLKSNKLGKSSTIKLTNALREYKLQSVCEGAKCPNKGECFERGTATFMILGDTCTRDCTFCAVKKSQQKLPQIDIKEPKSIALLSHKMKLKHIVITTVTRDDLPDGGASQFVLTIKEIRKICENDVSVEVLISDLQGNKSAIKSIVDAKPDVLNHNIETIPSLYSAVRPTANYLQSLELLRYAKEIDDKLITKSGLMVGLGESKKQIISTMTDLLEVGVDILTIGQYIAPSKNHYEVKDYIHPNTFAEYKKIGLELGFKIVESAPLVRSSYHAEYAKELL